MSIVDLKQKLISKIEKIDNDDLLREAHRLIDLELKELNIPYELSDEMNSKIDIALEQIENGDTLSNTEANKEIERWLEE